MADPIETPLPEEYAPLIEALDTAGSTAGDFLGGPFPEDFQARRLARPRTDPTGGQFGEIDVPLTGRGAGIRDAFSEVDVDTPAGWGVQRRAKLKIDLIEAGLLTPEASTGPESWDPATRESYRQVLAFANLNGFSDPMDALDMIRRGTEEIRGELGGAQLPAPEDVRLSIRDAFIQRMGRRLPPDEEEALVDAYHGVVRDRQEAQMGAPSVEGFVEEQIESGEHAVEAEGFDLATRAQDFMRILGSPVPTPTPVEPTF